MFYVGQEPGKGFPPVMLAWGLLCGCHQAGAETGEWRDCSKSEGLRGSEVRCLSPPSCSPSASPWSLFTEAKLVCLADDAWVSQQARQDWHSLPCLPFRSPIASLSPHSIGQNHQKSCSVSTERVSTPALDRRNTFKKPQMYFQASASSKYKVATESLAFCYMKGKR